MAVTLVILYAYFFSLVSLSVMLTVGVNFTLLNELNMFVDIIETFI